MSGLALRPDARLTSRTMALMFYQPSISPITSMSSNDIVSTDVSQQIVLADVVEVEDNSALEAARKADIQNAAAKK